MSHNFGQTENRSTFNICHFDDCVFQTGLNMKCQVVKIYKVCYIITISTIWHLKFVKLRPLWKRLGSIIVKELSQPCLYGFKNSFIIVELTCLADKFRQKKEKSNQLFLARDFAAFLSFLFVAHFWPDTKSKYIQYTSFTQVSSTN